MQNKILQLQNKNFALGTALFLLLASRPYLCLLDDAKAADTGFRVIRVEKEPPTFLVDLVFNKLMIAQARGWFGS